MINKIYCSHSVIRQKFYRQNKEDHFMGNVRRVYVEKKPDFAVKAKELKHEVK